MVTATGAANDDRGVDTGDRAAAGAKTVGDGAATGQTKAGAVAPGGNAAAGAPPRTGWAAAVLVPLALAAALALPGLALGHIYHGPLIERLVAGAAAASVLSSLVTRRLPAWSAAPVSVLALAGYAALAIRVSAASGGLTEPFGRLAVDTLRNAVPGLLTATLPVEAQPDTVLVPVVTTWLAGLAGAELALRSRRVLFGFGPAVLLYAGALYLIGPHAARESWQPLAFVGCAAVALAASGRGGVALPELSPAQRATLRLRVVAGAAAGLAVVMALVAAVSPRIASQVGHRPSDPRRYVEPPQHDSLDDSPLARLSGWAVDPDQPLLRVRLSGPGTESTVPGETRDIRVRLAVMTEYDGVSWQVDAAYRSAGRILPGPQPAAGSGEARPEVVQAITIEELDGKYLPAVARPQRVDGVRVSYDQETGTVALPGGLRPGLRYTVVSREPTFDPNLLVAADVPAGEEVARFLSLGTTPPPEQMQRLVERLAEGIGGAYQKAEAIETFLAEHYRLVADAASGHAYPNLRFFLFDPVNAGGQKGTSEQFAAAFAVLGRMMGLPTRVVVGFGTGTGSETLRAADAYAWPEVLFTGLGWVPFSPTPQKDTKPRPLEDDFKPKPVKSTPPPSVAPTVSVSVGPGSAEPGAAAEAPKSDFRTLRTIMLVGGVASGALLAMVLVGLFVVVPLLRHGQRRRRLRAPDPGARVTGAWHEVLDAIELAGQPPPPSLAAHEVAERAALPQSHRTAALRRAAPDVAGLATLVNVAAFAPYPPGEAEAQQATEQAAAYVAELRARHPWWRRLLWTVDPRPLGWARRRRRPRP